MICSFFLISLICVVVEIADGPPLKEPRNVLIYLRVSDVSFSEEKSRVRRRLPT